jgi:SEC-C motif/Tetratricopeptide repeat
VPTAPSSYGQLSTGDLVTREQVMALKCSACGKTREHKVGQVIVDPDFFTEIDGEKPANRLGKLTSIAWEKWISFTGYFVCPACGSGGPWNFPARAKRQLQWLIIQYVTGNKEALFIGKLTLFDGTAPRTCFDGVAHLQRLIDVEPTNAYLWNRLGNLYRSAGEYERALPAFDKAAELEPRCVETQHSLAECCLHRNDNARAADYYHQVLRLCRTGIWRNERLKENVVQHTLEMLVDLNQRSGGKIEVFPPREAANPPAQSSETPVVFLTSFDLVKESDWQRLVHLFLHGPPEGARAQYSTWEKPKPPPAALLAGKKPDVAKATGRNDPCPCGSGRKFKHCCY